MIYTCTLSPAIDYLVKLDEFKAGEVNRMQKEQLIPGGKGINVSTLLKNVGIENVALGFIGGFTGEFIESGLKKKDINTDFVYLEEPSRINVKIHAKEESEINAVGPSISEEKLKELLAKIDRLKKGDVLVMAGSIPATLPQDLYNTIAEMCRKNGVDFAVDTTGQKMVEVLKYKPFMVKPNHKELAEMFNVEVKSKEDAIKYGSKLQDMGARNVIISMAGEGAVLISEDGIFTASAPKGKVKNSVGAGDSMVAGFIGEYIRERDYGKALKFGAASGSATAFSYDIATNEFINTLLNQIEVKRS